MSREINIQEKEAFEKKCYEAYQLDWMMSHGFSLMDALNVVRNSLIDQFEEEPATNGIDNYMQCAIEEFLDESGFGSGTLFVCFEEFLDHEYIDPHYMKRLLGSLPESDILISQYIKYTNVNLSCVPEFTVPTTAGYLHVYKATDPGQPGVVVMLQPEGYEEEIDTAYVSVYEDPEYRTKDNEGEKDVVIMSYGDATTEDYTTKEIIRRSDIEAGLSEE